MARFSNNDPVFRGPLALIEAFAESHRIDTQQTASYLESSYLRLSQCDVSSREVAVLKAHGDSASADSNEDAV